MTDTSKRADCLDTVIVQHGIASMPVEKFDAIMKEIKDLRAKPYHYMGKDGNTISARALEEQRDAATERAEKAESAIREWYAANPEIGALTTRAEKAEAELGEYKRGRSDAITIANGVNSRLRARVAALEGAINKGLDAFTALAGQSNDPSVNAIQIDAIASMEAALSAAPAPQTVDDPLTPAQVEYMCSIRPRAPEDEPAVSHTHALERTNPKGEPFRGRCILCGATDLPMRAATEPCLNPRGLSEDDALLALTDGPPAPAVSQAAADVLAELRARIAKLETADQYWDAENPEDSYATDPTSVVECSDPPPGVAVELLRSRSLQVEWGIALPIKFDADGEAEDYEVRTFATEEEAVAAYEKATKRPDRAAQAEREG